MAIKINAYLVCDNCKKIIHVRGAKPWRGRRSSGFYFDNLYQVKASDYEVCPQITVERGYSYSEGDDGRGVCCSAKCACEKATKLIIRLKPPKREDD